MSKAASLNELQELHRNIAKAMNKRLELDETDGVFTDAASLGVMVKFLKDNGVTADPADREDLTSLRENLKKQAAARKSASVIELVKQDMAKEA